MKITNLFVLFNLKKLSLFFLPRSLKTFGSLLISCSFNDQHNVIFSRTIVYLFVCWSLFYTQEGREESVTFLYELLILIKPVLNLGGKTKLVHWATIGNKSVIVCDCFCPLPAFSFFLVTNTLSLSFSLSRLLPHKLAKQQQQKL